MSITVNWIKWFTVNQFVNFIFFFCLVQIVSGIFLSFHYAPTADAFLNIDFIMREVNEG
jgi:quinol-cytochrome oxidoreductase complex cytochrome b subunit